MTQRLLGDAVITDPGLSAAEARRRLQRDGPNELGPARRRTAWRIGLEVAREPMFQLLLAAGVIYLLLGDIGEALRDLTSPRALVIRDGQPQRIAGNDRTARLGHLTVQRQDDDDFGSIVNAIRLGRRFHDNPCKAMAFVFAVREAARCSPRFGRTRCRGACCLPRPCCWGWKAGSGCATAKSPRMRVEIGQDVTNGLRRR